MNKGLKVRRGAGSFNKSVMFVTAPSGSTVTMQNMVRSDNLATDVQYQEASAKDQSCVTITQCGEVSKGDRVKVSLEVTASKDAVGYWASESGLITDKREVNLKSGKQTVTLDITASGNLSLDTKFFCKGDDSDATITAANLQIYKYTAGTTIKTATEKNGVWRFNGLDLGLWLIKAEKDDQTPATQEFEIKEFGVYRTSMAFFAATIKITYPGGSTCTCSKDHRTYTAPDTSGAWDCVVDSAGEWTVKITADGEDPVSEVVSISEDGETKSIELAYTPYIFKEGSGLADGATISKSDSVSASSTTNHIAISGEKDEGYMVIKKSYDATKFNTLVIELEANAKESLVGVSKSSSGISDTSFAAKYRIMESFGRKELKIDIRSVQGDVYFAYWDAPYRTADIKIYNIYLTR